MEGRLRLGQRLGYGLLEAGPNPPPQAGLPMSPPATSPTPHPGILRPASPGSGCSTGSQHTSMCTSMCLTTPKKARFICLWHTLGSTRDLCWPKSPFGLHPPYAYASISKYGKKTKSKAHLVPSISDQGCPTCSSL